MIKSLSEKMGFKESMRAIFINAPADAIKAINPSALAQEAKLTGDFDYIHLFVHNQTAFHEQFPILKGHLKQTGMLWVSWPKAGQQGTDLTLTKVIELGYNYGLVESKTLSINTTWSAIKFTHPKEGKVYQNSYGKLKI